MSEKENKLCRLFELFSTETSSLLVNAHPVFPMSQKLVFSRLVRIHYVLPVPASHIHNYWRVYVCAQSALRQQLASLKVFPNIKDKVLGFHSRVTALTLYAEPTELAGAHGWIKVKASFTTLKLERISFVSVPTAVRHCTKLIRRGNFT